MNSPLLLLLLLVFSVVGVFGSDTSLTKASFKDALIKNKDSEDFKRSWLKSVDSLNKIYEKRDEGRRDVADGIKRQLKDENWANNSEAIADGIFKLYGWAAEKPKDNLMLNLHTLHVLEKMMTVAGKSEEAKRLHALYDQHRLFFQTDGVVKIMIWGSLLVVFAAASYQTLFTIKKRL